MKKICITSLGSTSDSLVDTRFGRANFFILLDEKGNIEEVIPNPGAQAFRAAGVLAAQELVNKKVNAVISGNIGPNSFSVLQGSGIEIFLAPANVSVKEAFDLWREGKLSPVSTPSVSGFGRGFGRGFGKGGFGRGRGGGFGRGRWF